MRSASPAPLEADLLNGVPWLQVIQAESMAGLSTIEMIFAPGTDLMKARQRINIHGAIDLQTGQTQMIEALTIDAASTIRLLESIEALYPMLVLIHVFLDNARYQHAKLVREWLARPVCRIKLHFTPPYCPHLNPIERLWGLMHRNVTHNKCHATCGQFADVTLDFLRDKVPKNWRSFRDSVTDNFRVINPKDFRVLT